MKKLPCVICEKAAHFSATMFPNALLKALSSCIDKRILSPFHLNVRPLSLQDLKVGDSAKESRVFTQTEVNEFATLSGDNNPVHIDSKYVKKAGVYEGTIVHGAFVNAFVSAILGTKLPGSGAIAVSQEIRYTKPLYVGETVEGEVAVVEIKKRFVTFSVKCTAGNKTVYEGKAVVWMQKQG